MAAPTSIEVTISDTEFSRYEPGRDTVTASIVVIGSTFTAEQIRVDLVKARRSRDAVIATATITVNGASPQTDDVDFYLPNIVDQDFLNMARHGEYFVRATSITDDTIIGESENFRVAIMTVDKFKANFLFGLRLTATQIQAVKYQPVSITGVEVIEVSNGAQPGFGTLTYTYLPGSPPTRKLSWKSGPQVLITKPGTYILRAGSNAPGGCGSAAGGEYIVVKVKSLALLPTMTVMEDLLIENKTIDDQTFEDFLDRSLAWIENEIIWSSVEPTNVVTERDATTIQFASNTAFPDALFLDTDYDKIVNPLTYFAPKRGTWVTINTQFMQLLRVDMLYGALGGVRVMDVDLDWCQISGPGGMIQLVPYNNIVGFTFMGHIWNSTLNNMAELPNFWHFNMMEGLRDMPPELMELLGKKAAMDALVVLGAALRPGVGSVSLGRDGVSESVSYSNQKYGNYTGAIQAYKDWLEGELPRFKSKYRGLGMIVV